ncbi:MAG: Kiwa anti-phage protein KwaB-like domain-containing protein, partial [Roseateles sp.]|uniref:Kiwa anti-phage protein KwaB-like domain-containing protein n=1 Tax=Roseateles sp. TaxID=1971397 RepID=UPI0040350726
VRDHRLASQNSQQPIWIEYLPGSSDHRRSPRIPSVHAGGRGSAGPTTVVNVVLRANRLELVEDRSFTIAKSLDFVVLDNNIMIINKRSFEALLNYRLEYTQSFATLQTDPTFSACFTDLTPLIIHVGTNTMHLRRMAVIQQKANYANPTYMQRLRDVNAQEGWNIEFDTAGRIVATEDTMRAIMQVLLNHRLHSKLSLTTFDVPSAAAL